MKTTKQELQKFITDLVMEQFDLNQDEIYDAAKLQDDLGIDSLDKVEISCEIDKKFEVDVDEQAIDNATTFGELVDAAFSAFENTEG